MKENKMSLLKAIKNVIIETREESFFLGFSITILVMLVVLLIALIFYETCKSGDPLAMSIIFFITLAVVITKAVR